MHAHRREGASHRRVSAAELNVRRLGEFEDDLAYLSDPSRTEAELFGKPKE